MPFHINILARQFQCTLAHKRIHRSMSNAFLRKRQNKGISVMSCTVYSLIGFLHTLQTFSCGLLFQTRQQMNELQELLYLLTGGDITGERRMSSECCGWLLIGSSGTEDLS